MSFVLNCSVFTCADFVLELASGGELYDLIRSFGKLPEPLAAHIAAELADVLSYIHARGIVHRDVKPENILISETVRMRATALHRLVLVFLTRSCAIS